MKRYHLSLFLLPLALIGCQDGRQPLAAPDEAALAAAAGDAEYAPGRLLARFRPGVNIPAIAAAHGVRIEREIALGIRMLQVPVGRELAIARALSRNPGIVWAEPDFIRTFGEPCGLGACTKPDDPFFGYKWDLHNNGKIVNSLGEELASTGKVGADMDWLEAFDHLGTGTGGEVRIGILDTGIRADHQEFAGRLVAQRNFHSNNNNAADDHGHGTHVAGIAAALGNDGNGVPGVAYGSNVRLVIAKVCGPIHPPRFGQSYGCSSSSIVNGIKWAADQGVAVMNLSLGGSSASSGEQEALQYARGKGALPICAAGNNGTGSVSYPARFPECVAVSATNWSDGLASYSNWGDQIDLSGPGGDRENSSGYSYVLSAYHDGTSSYAFMAGTSMASPQVAGLAVLLHALGMTNHTTKLDHMRSTSDDLGPAGWDARFGHGRINVYEAVKGFTGGAPRPAAPSNLAAAAVSTSRIDLSWTDNATNETGFRLERCTGSGCNDFAFLTNVGARSGTGAVGYSDTGLQPNTTYRYRVRAYKSDGHSDWSNTAGATTNEETTPPPGQGPTASFTYSCGNSPLCNFTDTSTAGSATINGWSWAFEHGNPSSATTPNPSGIRFPEGNHRVDLTVTDANGRTSTTSQTVSCSTHQRHGVRCR